MFAQEDDTEEQKMAMKDQALLGYWDWTGKKTYSCVFYKKMRLQIKILWEAVAVFPKCNLNMDLQPRFVENAAIGPAFVGV